MRVLVVDDSPTARRMLRLVLADLTDLVVVGEATSGEECLSRLDELAPDIVVMDWRMPGMNGAETTAAARSRDPNLRVIGFTSSGEAQTREVFLAAGAEAVFAKEEALRLRDYLAALGRGD